MRLGVPRSTFDAFMRRRREQLAATLLDALQPPSASSCLELGGPTPYLEIAQRFGTYIVLNLSAYSLSTCAGLSGYGATRPVLADATRVPFADGAFDYVVSNSLIEHVPPALRGRLAVEMRRVARRGYFLSAPNYWFPLEPHYQMPIFQFLPERLKHAIVQRQRVGHIWRDGYEPISLVTRRELQRLFPEATLGGLSFSKLLAETLYAWHIVP